MTPSPKEVETARSLAAQGESLLAYAYMRNLGYCRAVCQAVLSTSGAVKSAQVEPERFTFVNGG